MGGSGTILYQDTNRTAMLFILEGGIPWIIKITYKPEALLFFLMIFILFLPFNISRLIKN
jgi:hypothetical protein